MCVGHTPNTFKPVPQVRNSLLETRPVSATRFLIRDPASILGFTVCDNLKQFVYKFLSGRPNKLISLTV